MRRLWIAGLVVVSLTGGGYAQVERQEPRSAAELASDPFDATRNAVLNVEYQRLPQACTDTTGVAHPLGETISLKGVELRCVQTAIILF